MKDSQWVSATGVSPCVRPVHDRVNLKMIINENTYTHGTGRISSFFNEALQERLEPTPIFVPIMLFWSRNTLGILLEFPQKIIPYLISE